MPLLTLRIAFVDSRWSWFLKDQDAIDVYVGAVLVTTLDAAILRQLVSHYLTQAHLTATLLERPLVMRRGLASAPTRGGLPPGGVPPVTTQEARKAKRHARHPRP